MGTDRPGNFPPPHQSLLPYYVLQVSCRSLWKTNPLFKHSWLSQYNGLVYSKIDLGATASIAFCLGRLHTWYLISLVLWSQAISPICRRPVRSCMSTSLVLAAVQLVSTWQLLRLKSISRIVNSFQLTSNHRASLQDTFWRKERY